MAISYNTTIVRNGLVLHLDAANPKSYPGSGTAWKDLSGLGNNAALTNGPTFDSANKGSFALDGTNDYVELGDVLDLGTNDLTVVSWVKLTSTLTESATITSKARAAGQDYRHSVFFNTNRNLVSFFQGNGGADIVPATVAQLDLNKWCMCSAVYTRSSAIKMHFNAEVQALSGNATISQWSGLNFQSNNPFRVGTYTASDNTSLVSRFLGQISTVSVYFRALSDAEIKQNFEATRGRYGL